MRRRYHAADPEFTPKKRAGAPPSFVDTRMTFGMDTKIPIASPQEAAQAIFNAQQRRTDVLYYPRFWAGIMGVIRSLPEPIFKRLSL